MRLENLKEEFPAMPEEIRQMIAQEVATGLHAKSRIKKRKWTWKKAAVIALAATLAVGTTVIAGTRLYQWRVEKEGNYGLKAKVVAQETPTESESLTLPEEIPEVSIEAGYLPEGMIAAEDGSSKYYYQETPYQGGVSIAVLAMDEDFSADKLPVSDLYVTASEQLTLGEQDAIYLEKQIGEGADISFDKKIYLAFPKYWQILEIFIGEDVSKNNALKIAENLKLTPTGKTKPREEFSTWGAMLQEESVSEEIKQAATKKEMKNIYKIGDTMKLSVYATVGEQEWVDTDVVTGKVTEVQIADDLSLLGDAYADEEMKTALGPDGKLVQNKISYIHAGDGKDSLDETVYTEDVNQKLVYITVEYTNTGEQEIKDMLFFGSFVGLLEDTDGYVLYDRAGCDDNEKTDFISTSSIGGLGEMNYYDVHGGERDNNYIPLIQPGETATVHMAKIVNEDELDKMYVSLETQGGAYEFTKESLQTGYVDIRQ